MSEKKEKAALVLFLTGSLPEPDLALFPVCLRERVSRHAHPEGRRQSALLWGAFLSFAREFGADPDDLFFTGEGKPEFRNTENCERPARISVSHTRGAAGILLSTCPCGLDLEEDRQASKRLIEKVLNPSQKKALEEGTAGFSEIWTKKEAQIKISKEHAGSPLKGLPDNRTRIFSFRFAGIPGALAFEKDRIPETVALFCPDPEDGELVKTDPETIGLNVRAISARKREDYGA